MTTTTTTKPALTVAEIAAECGRYLTRKKRNDDDRKAIVIQTDDAPEWFTDICHEAHGDFLPDDWRYEFIEDALVQLENDDEDTKDIGEAYPYNHDRAAWLASNCNRGGYCDEAAEDFGHAKDIYDAIANGMQREYEEVYSSIKSSLEELAEERTEESELAAHLADRAYVGPAESHARKYGTAEDADKIADHDETSLKNFHELTEFIERLNVAEAAPQEIEDARQGMREAMARIMDDAPGAAREYCERNGITLD
jgi:hypothetical protein